MTEHEKDDIKATIEVLKTILADCDDRILYFSARLSDEDYRFLLNKAARTRDAIAGFQKLLDDDTDDF